VGTRVVVPRRGVVFLAAVFLFLVAFAGAAFFFVFVAVFFPGEPLLAARCFFATRPPLV
jgi:hypothetical protein